jgi:hypothetical protein
MTSARTEPARARATKAARPAAKAQPPRQATATKRQAPAAKKQPTTTPRGTTTTPARKAAAPARKAAAPARKAAAPARKAATPARTAGRPTSTQAVSGEVTTRRPARDAVAAIQRAVRRDSRQLQLPVVGRVPVPSTEDLAYYGGVTALVVLGLVDWPVALLLGVGHELAASKHRTMLRSFGEALEVA